MNIEKLLSATCLWEERQRQRKKIENKYSQYTGTLFALTDIHSPFTLFKLFAQKIIPTIKETKKNNVIVLGGDTFSFNIFSKFLNIYHDTHKLLTEINNAKCLISELCKISTQIVMLKSNHEDRFDKWLLRRSGADITGQLKTVGTGLTEWLKGLPANFIMLDDWFVKIGDCVIAHPHNMSVIPGRAGVWATQYFQQRYNNINVVLCGHTHRCSKVIHHRIVAIETGMLAKTFDYNRNGNISIGKYTLLHKGYGVDVMKKGKSDLNEANFKILEFEEPL